MVIKEKIGNAPDRPGVYIIKDKDGDAIYIGKAVSIRKRLRGHFKGGISGRQGAIAENAADIDYIITPDEPAALLLEAALVKRFGPRYNVTLRDDKSYPRLKLTVNEEWPRIFITRKVKSDGALYFGPYTNAKLLRRALAFMKRSFPLRTCNIIPKKECLNFHIGQCLAPCIDRTRRQEYLKVIEEMKLFLDGKRDELIESLAAEMKEAAAANDYEKAARTRDRIRALSSVVGRPQQDMSEPLKEPPRFSGAQQIEELRMVLNLHKAPSLIEAFDISNTSGKEATGSMVSFKDGDPDKNNYRRFLIKTVEVIDDYNMMREIVSRRYRRLLDEKGAMPDLIIIDGGKGHLAAAKKELQGLGLWKVPVVSIAKNPDRIFRSEEKEPVMLGRFEGALLLAQRIRDEAHRFAIGYHRLLRAKKHRASELDDIEGIGPKRKALLIRYFGSVDGIMSADIEDLKKVEFISEKEARAIYEHFRR